MDDTDSSSSVGSILNGPQVPHSYIFDIPPEVKTEPIEIELSCSIKSEYPVNQSGLSDMTPLTSTWTWPTLQPMMGDTDPFFRQNQLVKDMWQEEDSGFVPESKSVDQSNGATGELAWSFADDLIQNDLRSGLKTNQTVICCYCGMMTIFGCGYLSHMVYCSLARVMCVCQGCGKIYPKPKYTEPSRFSFPEADRFFCLTCPRLFCFQADGDFLPESRWGEDRFVCWYCGFVEKIAERPKILPGVAPVCQKCAWKLKLSHINNEMDVNKQRNKVKVTSPDVFPTNQEQALYLLSQIRSLMGCEKPSQQATGNVALIRLCTSMEAAIKKSRQLPTISDATRKSIKRKKESTTANRTLFMDDENVENRLVVGECDRSIAQRDDDFELYLERRRVCDLLERKALESGQIKPCCVAVHRLREKGHRPSALTSADDLVLIDRNQKMSRRRRKNKKSISSNARRRKTLKRLSVERLMAIGKGNPSTATKREGQRPKPKPTFTKVCQMTISEDRPNDVSTITLHHRSLRKLKMAMAIEQRASGGVGSRFLRSDPLHERSLDVRDGSVESEVFIHLDMIVSAVASTTAKWKKWTKRRRAF